MNVTTWNQFGISEVLFICLAMVGFLSVIAVIVTAGGRINRREIHLSRARRLQNLEPEENVLEDTKVGLTDPD